MIQSAITPYVDALADDFEELFHAAKDTTITANLQH